MFGAIGAHSLDYDGNTVVVSARYGIFLLLPLFFLPVYAKRQKLHTFARPALNDGNHIRYKHRGGEDDKDGAERRHGCEKPLLVHRVLLQRIRASQDILDEARRRRHGQIRPQ